MELKSYAVEIKNGVRWIVVRVGIGVACTALIFGGYFYHSFTAVNVVYAQNNATGVGIGIAPVLQRIADCESGDGTKGSGSQLNKKGEVITHTNSGGSVDVGKYQINLSADHIKEIAKLGLNVLTEEGNYAYAQYIYENHGTGDWSSSMKCWYK